MENNEAKKPHKVRKSGGKIKKKEEKSQKERHNPKVSWNNIISRSRPSPFSLILYCTFVFLRIDVPSGIYFLGRDQ